MSTRSSHRIDVGLIASTPGGAENLGLCYLSAALRAAGHTPHVVTFDSWPAMERAVRRLWTIDPPLIGVALSSGQVSIDALAAVHRLRRLGWRGHLTSGGAFATLARRRILADYPIIDSVVRYDGEIPIVLLADAVAAGADPSGVPGLTTRDGDGPPAPVDREPFVGLRPEHDRFRLYAGVPSAKISAVRGCWGRCKYCGLAAVRREKRAEARRLGLSAAQVREAGIGGMRRRPAADVADELSTLYRRHGVQFFHFIDENNLPRSPAQALEAIAELAAELERRRMGPRAISMMLRADIATRAVVDALADLGLVRTFLGVESLTSANLDALGRAAAREANATAMANLARRNVLFHFNLLLVHPYSTLASISTEIEELRRVRGGLLDPFEVEVYEGTDFFRSLEHEGRLRGGPLLWSYTAPDEETGLFARIFYALRHRAMGQVPLTAFAYDIQGLLAVSARLGRIGDARRPLARELDRLTDAHNRLWIEILEEGLELAARGTLDGVGALVDRTRRRAAELTLALEVVRRRIERACRQRPVSEIMFPRAAAAVALASAVISGGCWSGADLGPPGHPDDPFTDTDTGTDTGAADTDSSTDGDADTDTAPDGDTATDTSIAADCTSEIAYEEHVEVIETGVAAGCEHPCYEIYNWVSYRFVLDGDGYVVDVEREDGEPFPAELKQCYLDAVEGQQFPCLALYPYWEPCEGPALE